MSLRVNAGSALLKMYNQLLSLIETNAIKPPAEYHQQVTAVKEALKCDESGLVNTILDFAIECASSVQYKVECDNENLAKIYNEWLKNINASLRRKKVEVGVNGLAKQYYLEMLKGSSQALLRVIYNKSRSNDSMELPDLMWFVDGKDIYIKDSKRATKKIGDEEYKLKIGNGDADDDYINLPHHKNEEIFVQTPFDAWGTLEPEPFLIRRGIWKNMKVLEMISEQGEGIVRKALKYLLVVLKGNDKTFDKHGLYEPGQLTEAKQQFKNFLGDLELEGGTPAMVANYDTKIDHLIPDFTKVIKQELQDPSTRKILQGLGLIEVLEGTGQASRKEAIINPKPFIKLVYSLINSYCKLLTDVLEVTRERNEKNKKYNAVSIKVKASPVIEFIGIDEKEFLRTVFDRGVVDYETFCDSIGIDYSLILARSKKQMEDGVDSILYPHIIMNTEQNESEQELRRFNKKPKDKEVPNYKDDRMKPGNPDFVQAKSFDGAPYKKLSGLPTSIKKLPLDLQRKWKDVWNRNFNKYHDEPRAFRLANGIIRKLKKE